MKKHDKKHLVQKGLRWYFHKRIPKNARHISNGSKFLVRSLKTDSLREAQKRRDTLLADIQSAVAKVYRNHDRDIYETRLAILRNDLNQRNARIAAHSISLDNKYHSLPDLHAADTFLSGTEYPAYGYTLRDGVKGYRVKKLKKLKDKKDINKIKLAVDSFLKHIGKNDIPLLEIRRKQVISWYEKLDKAGSTKSSYLTELRGIWKYAIDIEEIRQNEEKPFHDHEVDTSDKRPYKAFSDSELDKIFITIKDIKRQSYKLIVRLGLVTGCRISELCNLRVEDVKEREGFTYISIRDGKTKAAKRDVPIHNWVKNELLEQAKGKTDYLFDDLTTDRNGRRSTGASQWFGRLKKKLNINDDRKCFHSFRKHAATAYERGGVPENVAAQIIGHENGKGLTFGLYSDGFDLKPLFEALHAARFPDFVKW